MNSSSVLGPQQPCALVLYEPKSGRSEQSSRRISHPRTLSHGIPAFLLISQTPEGSSTWNRTRLGTGPVYHFKVFRIPLHYKMANPSFFLFTRDFFPAAVLCYFSILKRFTSKVCFGGRKINSAFDIIKQSTIDLPTTINYASSSRLSS